MERLKKPTLHSNKTIKLVGDRSLQGRVVLLQGLVYLREELFFVKGENRKDASQPSHKL